MKTTNFIWIIMIVSLLLVVTGCGDKEDTTGSSETVTVEGDTSGASDTAEQAEEPQSVVDEQGVTESGSDITSDVSNDSMVNETEDYVPPADVETSSDESEGTDNSSDDTAEETKTAQNFRVISLKDLKAYPEELHVKVGTTIEWRNVNDNLQHIIGWNGQKNSGIKPEPILQGESWSYTFNSPVVIKWFSTARPTVQGVIYIEE